MTAPLLYVEALSVERGGRVVLSRIGFTLGPSETILVSGRNGAGKSTLLRTLSGLLAPVSGRIVYRLANDDTRGIETVHYLGYEDALKPSLTVGENLDFWTASLRSHPAGDRPSSTMTLSPHEALAAFGIARLIDLPAAYLSAGQKRRVALARLLIAPRPIWLLDEPLIALDVAAQAILTGIMSDHVGRGGAILVASHQPLALIHRELALDGSST